MLSLDHYIETYSEFAETGFTCMQFVLLNTF
jgi:hypothetical protein